MNFVIEQATLTQAKAKMAIVGPAGSGKTFTALITAQELGNRILVIDTENGSSVKYADRFNFQVLRLTDYRLETYIAALEFVSEQDFDVVIVDSLSHAWAGPGGALEAAEKAKSKYGGNKFAGWADVTPLQNKLIATILNYPSHLIATMRMKIEYALIDQGNGKTKPQKLGLGIVQRDSFEYEFDVIAEMDIEHNLRITKTRCSALDNVMENKPDGKIGKVIAEWLSGGKPAPPTIERPATTNGKPQNGGSKQPSTNGDAMTQFWTYQREEGIDRQIALDILKDAKGDFEQGKELLKQYNDEFNREPDEGNPPIDAKDARQMASR